MKKYKVYFFAVLVLLFSFIFFKSFFPNNVNLSKIYSDNEKVDNLVDAIIADKQQVVYNKNESRCYIPNINFLKKSKISVLSDFTKVKIYLNYIDGKYNLIAFTDKYYQVIEVIVTKIPIVSVYDMDIPKYDNDYFNRKLLSDCFEDEKNISNVGVHFFGLDNLNIKSEAQMSVRGASSQLFDKKAYKLKFTKKVKFISDYNDDVWVLDASYTDKSKIRNKLSSDIWNLINNNQKINNDLHVDYCELFINNEYAGLYTLKNKVNRNITGVTDDGILIKSIAILRPDYVDGLLNSNFKVSDGYFLNYEIKKYSNNGYYSIISKLKDYYSYYYDVVDYDIVHRDYDIDNFINYKIFVALIGGNDNATYNQYISLSNSNSKILTTPWDMDLTWGLKWDDYNGLHSYFSIDSSYDLNWMNSDIIFNMDFKTFNLLKQRYWELRKDIITMDTINGYLNSYKQLFVDSEAASRDSERWYEYDVEYEIEQIREWAIRRIQFLDEYFK